MKLTDLFVVILIVIGVVSIPVGVKQKRMIESEALKVRYNEIIDNAVKDSAKTLLDPIDNESIETLGEGKNINFKTTNLNLDKALWRFYQSMFLNLNIENDYMKQQAFLDKVPIKLTVGYDGYYINTWTEVIENGKNKVKEIWQPKKEFLYYDNKNNIKVNLTLDDFVYVTDMNTNEKLQGKQEEFKDKYKNMLFSDKFDQMRRQIIVDSIRKDLEYYSSLNNEIALKNGWGYTLKLPLIDEKAINDITFIAFFQGLPLNGIELYNTYGFGVARVVRNHNVYGNEESGVKYYHTDKCNNKTNSDVIFDSPIDACKNGYYPHPLCN
ncbi:hypothetical protein [Clostridium sp. UBA6640]|uniref:hypothetical protein n=1 Tax=Clostridium sp. UBA6640 TaxID=1946370 RepID=UPI0025C51933|nr:hypothetical protein [Clostridium sp. UBA6640]